MNFFREIHENKFEIPSHLRFLSIPAPPAPEEVVKVLFDFPYQDEEIISPIFYLTYSSHDISISTDKGTTLNI